MISIKQLIVNQFKSISPKIDLKKKFNKISFSQSGEDLIVQFIFNELSISNPSYLDIGAHHPYYLNNTAIFYQRGCRGINIEPDPILFNSFPVERPYDININVGISDKEGDLDFYIMNVPTLNTFSKIEAEKYSSEGNFYIKEIKKLKVDTVSNLINQFNNGLFPDFLTIDAEGVDELVLKSIDFERNKPIVICVETISFSSKGKGVKNISTIEFLKSKGYMHYADTNINSIFVSIDKWERF
jgi:FkbM family methyltransferase